MNMKDTDFVITKEFEKMIDELLALNMETHSLLMKLKANSIKGTVQIKEVIFLLNHISSESNEIASFIRNAIKIYR